MRIVLYVDPMRKFTAMMEVIMRSRATILDVRRRGSRSMSKGLIQISSARRGAV